MINDPITIIIPTFNEEKRIEKCLRSIREQNYPQNKIEILIVDDLSSDKTIPLAKKFRVKILKNGDHNIERGKSIGLEYAKTDLVLFLDADNILRSKDWIRKAVNIFKENKDLSGVQSFRFLYKKNDTLANRYCALFGINDPIAFYLGKRGLLMTTEDEWIYKDTLIENKKDYFLVRFNIKNLPTIGSQGYMTRKSLLLNTHWKPRLFHLDSAYDLVKKGQGKFAFIKIDIEHEYAESIYSMLKKLNRNIYLYWKFQKIRRYKYKVSRLKFIYVLLAASTFIIPLFDSIKGYYKKKDIAWFLHPVLCFIVVGMYGYMTMKHLFFNFLGYNMYSSKSSS